MAGDKPHRKPVHEEFAEQIIADIKKGVAPWQKPWRPGELHPPLNPVSGTVYSGINRVMLSRRGFEDPRWMTLRQANTKDCRVRKGEKSQTIVYWQFSKEEPALDDNGKPVTDAEGNQVKNKVELVRPVVRFSSVFHVSQLDGDIPPLDTAILTPVWNPNEKAEAILQNSGAVIKHNQRNRAFYSLRTDEICLPPQDHFGTADGYYTTALHELGHWTGHASRLARDFGPFGSETYAREELRAEIASWMVAQDMGIGHDPGQHLAYVDSWVASLEKDPYEIVRACRDAEKIKHYVLAMEQKQELSQAVKSAPAASKTLEDDSQEAAKEPAAKKVFLAVPFREKERAKAAGAKWDSEAKLWFAPEGSDMAKLRIWLPDKTSKASPAMPPLDEFALTLRDAGLDLKGQQPIMDGNIHRVPVQGGKPQALDGAYQGYLDGRPAGWYQNFLTGEKVNWKATGHTLTEEQKIALRLEAEQRSQQRERERLEQQDAVARQCGQDFAALPPIRPMAAISNPYLLRKGVAPLGDIKESSDALLLLVPLFNAAGELRNVQEISWDGGKRFQAGGEKKGCFCLIDPANTLEQGEILLAEGYATGVSLNMATEKPVAVAFDAGNLEPVALALREKYPLAKIAICADNDHAREQGNIGLEKAKQAALAVDGCVILPQFNRQELDSDLTDFNDLHNSRGLKEVTAQVAMGLSQEKSCELERQ